MTTTAADVAAARPAVEAIARRTPVLSSRTISERAGARVMLEAENLQPTGKLVVEGAGAVGVAALIEGVVAPPRPGTTVGRQRRREPAGPDRPPARAGSTPARVLTALREAGYEALALR